VVRGGNRRRVSVVPIIAIAIATVFGVTAIRAAQGQDGLKAAAIEQQYTNEQETHTLLSAQVAELSSPGRIADEADKLGLVPAANPVYLQLPETSSAAPPLP
jgi:cell division protein FtsL